MGTTGSFNFTSLTQAEKLRTQAAVMLLIKALLELQDAKEAIQYPGNYDSAFQIKM